MTTHDINILSSKSETTSGSSRKAILLENTVIKVPCNEACLGLELRNLSAGALINECCSYTMRQTFREWHAWNTCSDKSRKILCPILDYGFTENGMPYTLMVRAHTFCRWDDVSEYESGYTQDKEEEEGDNENSTYTFDYYTTYGETDDYDGNDLDKFRAVLRKELNYSNEKIEEIIGLIHGFCSETGVSGNDIFTNFSNIGAINGEFVIIDYGYAN